MKKEISRLDPNQRKDLIYKAAMELVQEFGPGVTRKMVADKCNISPGLINKYFGSGSRLINQAMSDYGIEEKCKSRTLQNKDARIEQVLEWACRVVKEEGEMALTNRRIFNDCEIGTYRVYLLFGGVLQLRKLALERLKDKHE